MTIARREIVAEGEIAAYHCMAKCVRGAFLCGKNKESGKNFEHRKEWIRQRLELLAGIFAIDVGSYAIMDNHLHLVLKTRPDVTRDWSAEEVTRRWRSLFGKRPVTKEDRAKTDIRIEIESADTKLTKSRKERLASISWFMKCICQPIAQRANQEEGTKGRFWEGRFRSQVLLDEAAIIACSAYVDLNPVRARMAKTPETSRFTSASDRAHPLQKTNAFDKDSRDAWLAPMATNSKSRQTNTRTAAVRRASNDEWIPLRLDEYLKLLDWSGRQIREDKKGAIPSELAPILERIKVAPQGWLTCVRHFGRLFKYAAGAADKMRERAHRLDRRWFQGISHCLDLFP